jgi:hypothetical protein
MANLIKIKPVPAMCSCVCNFSKFSKVYISETTGANKVPFGYVTLHHTSHHPAKFGCDRKRSSLATASAIHAISRWVGSFQKRISPQPELCGTCCKDSNTRYHMAFQHAKFGEDRTCFRILVSSRARSEVSLRGGG